MTQGLTEEWRACQRRVTEFELQYADQMMRYCRGKGRRPTMA